MRPDDRNSIESRDEKVDKTQDSWRRLRFRGRVFVFKGVGCASPGFLKREIFDNDEYAGHCSLEGMQMWHRSKRGTGKHATAGSNPGQRARQRKRVCHEYITVNREKTDDSHPAREFQFLIRADRLQEAPTWFSPFPRRTTPKSWKICTVRLTVPILVHSIRDMGKESKGKTRQGQEHGQRVGAGFATRESDNETNDDSLAR